MAFPLFISCSFLCVFLCVGLWTSVWGVGWVFQWYVPEPSLENLLFEVLVVTDDYCPEPWFPQGLKNSVFQMIAFFMIY